MIDVLPARVMSEIQNHLRENCSIAEGGFEQMRADEDSVAGALGERLRTTSRREVFIGGQVWSWQVTSRKFRGRGRGAAESKTGADGIFQIEVENQSTGQISRKGILFQGKMIHDRDSDRLSTQVKKMESFTPGESFVFEFGPEGYRAIKSSELLEGRRALRSTADEDSEPLGDMLADQFVPCTVGVRGMYYDSRRKVILVPGGDDIEARRYPIEHRISIDISHGPLGPITN